VIIKLTPLSAQQEAFGPAHEISLYGYSGKFTTFLPSCSRNVLRKQVIRSRGLTNQQIVFTFMPARDWWMTNRCSFLLHENVFTTLTFANLFGRSPRKSSRLESPLRELLFGSVKQA
jgi:hypothetical protein